MPVVTMEMPCLTIEQKRELVLEVTESCARILGAPKEVFYVFIKENSLENVGVGCVILADREDQ